MKKFSLHITKKEFYGNDSLDFDHKIEQDICLSTCLGARLQYTSDSRFTTEEGVQESNNELLFFNGIAYEYDDTYIPSAPLNFLHKKLQSNIESVSKIKGDFSGVLIRPGQVTVFTSKTNSKPIFYYEDSEHYICSSDILEIVRILKREGIRPSLNISACYSLLSFDYLIGQETLLEGIVRYQPATLTHVRSERSVSKQYFRFSNEADHSLSKEDHIEKLEQTFSRAVQNEFQKDCDLGLSHLVTLSGGLDSRMVLAYGRSLGFKEMTTICFSQSKHLEHTIAQRVAKQYKSEFIFRALDGGNYLKNIDETVKINGGAVVYSGAAHTLDMLSHLDVKQHGILHTGQMGDGILGTFLSKKAQEKPTYGTSLKQSPTAQKIQSYVERELKQFETNEMFKLYSKGFNAVFNGYRVIEQFTHFSSPFLDEDFMQAAFAIPAELRHERKIYFEWIADKLPSVAKMPTADTNLRPILGYQNFPINLIPKFQKYKNLALYKLNPSHVVSMNPFKKWFVENDSLSAYTETYYKSHLNFLDEEPALKADCEQLFNQSFAGAFRVLTLLSAIKQFRE